MGSIRLLRAGAAAVAFVVATSACSAGGHGGETTPDAHSSAAVNLCDVLAPVAPSSSDTPAGTEAAFGDARSRLDDAADVAPTELDGPIAVLAENLDVAGRAWAAAGWAPAGAAAAYAQMDTAAVADASAAVLDWVSLNCEDGDVVADLGGSELDGVGDPAQIDDLSDTYAPVDDPLVTYTGGVSDTTDATLEAPAG